MNSCSELLSALEALTLELQAAEAANLEGTTSSSVETEDDFVEVTLEGIEEASIDEKKNQRSIVLSEKEKLLVEKEKLLTDCKNQIQVQLLYVVCVYVLWGVLVLSQVSCC